MLALITVDFLCSWVLRIDTYNKISFNQLEFSTEYMLYSSFDKVLQNFKYNRSRPDFLYLFWTFLEIPHNP